MKAKANRYYNYFAVIKETNKIINGWDYLKVDGYNHSELMADRDHYFTQDLHEFAEMLTDEELKSDSQVKRIIKQFTAIKTKKQILAMGIDPYNFDNWHKKVN